MAATMVGSIETIVGVVGGPRPESMLVETDRHRMLVHDVDANTFLVLIAPRSMKAPALRREARRILARLGMPAPARRSKEAAPVGPPSSEASAVPKISP